jgi:hypothetical protein
MGKYYSYQSQADINGELKPKFPPVLYASVPALARLTSKLHSNTEKTPTNSFPPFHKHESIHFPTLYLLSNVHMLEGRVGTTWEISDTNILFPRRNLAFLITPHHSPSYHHLFRIQTRIIRLFPEYPGY